MSNQLALIERNLTPLIPQFSQLMVSVERNPTLLECTMPSIHNSAMTAATLGLEVDGVTGQGFLVPLKDHGTLKANFWPGYKGYNTLGGRSGYAITGFVVREGDAFEMDLAADKPFMHKRLG